MAGIPQASPDTPRRRKKVTTDQSLARRAAAAMLIFSVASVLDEGIILRIVERGPSVKPRSVLCGWISGPLSSCRS